MRAAGPVVAHSYIRFVTEGVGTPAPMALPAHLVVGGVYRHVHEGRGVLVESAAWNPQRDIDRFLAAAAERDVQLIDQSEDASSKPGKPSRNLDFGRVGG